MGFTLDSKTKGSWVPPQHGIKMLCSLEECLDEENVSAVSINGCLRWPDSVRIRVGVS